MCGRTVQTQRAVRAAAESLTRTAAAAASTAHSNSESSSPVAITVSFAATSSSPSGSYSSNDGANEDEKSQDEDNFNLSPGMDAFVFWKDDQGTIRADRKVWGLVTKAGTAASPIPEGMGKHFNNLMFNARSDTLYAKPTFARLANSGRTCVIAVDGFFEWKSELGKKQPYFVYRKKNSDDSSQEEQQRPFLLMAGLWTSVKTGGSDAPTLDTFTILTTEACKPLEWLHSRMPVVIWDEKLALQWLQAPSPTVHRQLDQAALDTAENVLQWHAVTPEMSNMKFRTADAIKALPKLKTVKSFFGAAAAGSSSKTKSATSDKQVSEKKATTPSSSKKRSAPQPTAQSSAKKGTTTSAKSNNSSKSPSSNKKASSSPARPIDSFFKPKKTTKK